MQKIWTNSAKWSATCRAYDEALFSLRRFHEQLEDGREAATEVRLLREYCRAADDERGGKPSFDTVYFF
jgi:hypothetical protein